MPFEEDLRLCREAVARETLQAEDLEAAVQEVERHRHRISLFVALLDLGRAEPAALLPILTRREGWTPVDGLLLSSVRFGELAKACGLIRDGDVETALALQRVAREEGRDVRIGEILAARKLLRVREVEELLRFQDRVLLLCPRCLVQFNGRAGRRRREWRCPRCEFGLRPVDGADSLAAAETVDGLETSARPAAQAGPERMVGRVIGGYRLLRPLGHGGMGQVYLGRHEVMEKHAAIKLLRRKLAGEARSRARFFQEARAASRLEHPNIVQVLDANEADGLVFLVLQYVEGTNLAARLRDAEAPGLETICAWTRDAALALAYAHGQGIVHRDVKPENLMITRDGTVKVMDFGLAKDLAEERKITQAGRVLGTPFFMSPEQCGGAEITGQADVYSLGVTLYYCVTSSYPFVGETPMRVVVQHLEVKPEPPILRAPNLPAEINRLILDMMRKDPRRRPTPVQVADRLGEFLAGRGRPVAPAPPEVRRTDVASRPASAPVPAAADLRTCLFCEADNPAERRRCQLCGEPLYAEQEIEVGMLDDERQCAECGKIIQRDVSRCRFCGARRCDACGRGMPKDASFCPRCGDGDPVAPAARAAQGWWRRLLGEPTRQECAACPKTLLGKRRVCPACNRRTCAGCGTAIERRFYFCPRCGKPQKPLPAPGSPSTGGTTAGD